MTTIKSVKEIKVSINFGDETLPVGRLAIADRQIYFEYDQSFIARKLEISPFRLPLKAGVSQFTEPLFEGLPGVFNDSLPDGWGRLLFDRFARAHGVFAADITPLERLAYVGSHALGALLFAPTYNTTDSQAVIDLDRLALQAKEVLAGSADDVLAELIALNGSSAGARPKALMGINEARNHFMHGIDDLPIGYTPWIVKFPNSQDGPDAGAIEYVYALMAKEAGIVMPDVHLFPAQQGAGYFATQRFDRDGKKRYHMHTVCGLLHADFRTPSLDYEDLVALTGVLTRDTREVERMYQLAVFNVLAHNRDDHAKNFSFLMDSVGQWQLSPAYDLTFSTGPHGEQSTMLMGEGRHPTSKQLLQLAEEAKVNKKRACQIIEATKLSLAKWPELAKQYGVSHANIKWVQTKIAQMDRI